MCPETNATIPEISANIKKIGPKAFFLLTLDRDVIRVLMWVHLSPTLGVILKRMIPFVGSRESRLWALEPP